MPLYKYRCECGAEFERLRSIAERLTATCDCGLSPDLMPTSASFVSAEWFRTVRHDGTVIGRRQTTETTPKYLTPHGREY